MTDDLLLPPNCPYALTSVKAFLTNDVHGLVFEAVLLHDGSPFATVSNDGRGGCDLLRPLTPSDRQRVDAYRSYADEQLGPQGVVWEAEDTLTSLLLERWAEAADEVEREGK